MSRLLCALVPLALLCSPAAEACGVGVGLGSGTGASDGLLAFFLMVRVAPLVGAAGFLIGAISRVIGVFDDPGLRAAWLCCWGGFPLLAAALVAAASGGLIDVVAIGIVALIVSAAPLMLAYKRAPPESLAAAGGSFA